MVMNIRVAIVEDEDDKARLVASHLQKEGFKVDTNLTGRIKAVLRRPKAEPNSKKMEIGGELVIDSTRHQVCYRANQIGLTSTEVIDLSLPACKKGWIFTRDQILDSLWGEDKITPGRTINVHIKNLREKLGKASRFIKNIRGIGYKLEE